MATLKAFLKFVVLGSFFSAVAMAISVLSGVTLKSAVFLFGLFGAMLGILFFSLLEDYCRQQNIKKGAD